MANYTKKKKRKKHIKQKEKGNSGSKKHKRKKNKKRENQRSNLKIKRIKLLYNHVKCHTHNIDVCDNLRKIAYAKKTNVTLGNIQITYHTITDGNIKIQNFQDQMTYVFNLIMRGYNFKSIKGSTSSKRFADTIDILDTIFDIFLEASFKCANVCGDCRSCFKLLHLRNMQFRVTTRQLLCISQMYGYKIPRDIIIKIMSYENIGYYPRNIW